MKQAEVCFHAHMVFLMGQILGVSHSLENLYARVKCHTWFLMFRKDLGPLGQHLIFLSRWGSFLRY